jgi:hypothetical protein
VESNFLVEFTLGITDYLASPPYYTFRIDLDLLKSSIYDMISFVMLLQIMLEKISI